MTISVGEKVSIVSGLREGQSGTVEFTSGTVLFVTVDEGTALRPYYESELSVPESTLKPKNTKQATAAVLRNLDKEIDGLRFVWESLISSETSLEDFKANALSWLKDKSELKPRTLDNCDWEEVYSYYKNMNSAS